MVRDKKTNERYRLDQLLEENGVDVTGLGIEAMMAKAIEVDLKSPKGNELSEARQFNLMFKTFVGPLKTRVHAYSCGRKRLRASLSTT